MNEDLFQGLVRPVNPKTDGNLPKFSYSKLDVFKQCPFRYDLQYNQNKRTDDTSIALELGTLCHKVLEEKGKMLVETGNVDYDKLAQIVKNGCIETDEKTRSEILGLEALKKKYWEVWFAPDSEGNSYDKKMELFDKVLHSEMEADEWVPTYFELPFELVWRDKYIIHGFIDRIDVRGEDYRTVDYKTSKRLYDHSKLATSMQFGIYALAILVKFNVLPVESMYRFILLDGKQHALTKGWEKRLIKALDKVFEQIDKSADDKTWVPKASPLCHWCSYSETNPNATKYKNECEYYSLWTTDNKTFAVNREYNPEDIKSGITKETRRLVF